MHVERGSILYSFLSPICYGDEVSKKNFCLPRVMSDSKNLLKGFVWGDCKSSAFFVKIKSTYRQDSKKGTQESKFYKSYNLYF